MTGCMVVGDSSPGMQANGCMTIGDASPGMQANGCMVLDGLSLAVLVVVVVMYVGRRAVMKRVVVTCVVPRPESSLLALPLPHSHPPYQLALPPHNQANADLQLGVRAAVTAAAEEAVGLGGPVPPSVAPTANGPRPWRRHREPRTRSRPTTMPTPGPASGCPGPRTKGGGLPACR